MKTVEILQGSDEWDSIRSQMPTASRFSELVTPAKLQYSASAKKYQYELLAKQLGVHCPAPPSFWMQHGIDEEPNAILCYERKNAVEVSKVGFVMLDNASAGGSPDGLIGDDGGIEVKCTAPETLISYHVSNKLPSAYVMQVQGYLWLTGREWWDFFAYHQDLPPFQIRIEADKKIHDALADAVPRFNAELNLVRQLFEEGKTGLDYLCDFGSEVVEL